MNLYGQLGSALLHAAAGFGLFLVLVNRILMQRRDSRIKILAASVAGLLLVGMPAGFGYLRPGFLLPAIVLALLLLGELHRLQVRRTCAGSPPIDTVPHRVRLATPFTTTDIDVHRYRVEHPKWGGPPLRIVHLTDLHVHHNLPDGYYREVMEAARTEKADLAFFTGDFISESSAIPRLAGLVEPIGTTGSIAVLGNHDYWEDADAVGRALADAGLRVLTDESCRFTVGAEALTVSGWDYPCGGRRPPVMEQGASRLNLVLAHTPDTVYRLADSGADFVFSGHCHAGQIRLPLAGPIVVPSVYGRRFDHGHFVVNGAHLFVAAGIGAARPPFRIYCRPDIFVVDIVSGTSAPA
jgi:predicted MPP superfamily phosphohydrolase